MNEIVFRAALIQVIIYFSNFVQSNANIYSWNLKESPLLLQFTVFFLIADLYSYITHYILHTKTFWRLHRLHHAAIVLGPLTGFRHSLMEKVYYTVTGTVLTSFLDVNDSVMQLVFSIQIFTCVLQHSRVYYNFPAYIKRILITTNNHRIHHAKKCYFKYGQNFGAVLSIWDQLFGTYVDVDLEEISIGVESGADKNVYKSYFIP